MSTATPPIPIHRHHDHNRRVAALTVATWSWVLHRITGATIFFFLFVHVLDTALGAGQPAGLQRSDRHLQDADRRPDGDRPRRGILCPARLNGVRIILIDFWQHGPRTPAVDAPGSWRVSGSRYSSRGLSVIGMHMAERFL